MPAGVLRSERPQLRQIIACERAALEADRFHWPEVLRDPPPGVQRQMSNLQSQVANLREIRTSHTAGFVHARRLAVGETAGKAARQGCATHPHEIVASAANGFDKRRNAG